MKHRLRPIAFLCLIYLVFIYFLVFHFNGLTNICLTNFSSPWSMFNETENYLKQNFYNKNFIDDIKLNIDYLLGKKEFDGVFYNDKRYIKKLNIDKTNQIPTKNIAAIKKFADKIDKHSSIVVVPTAASIYQDDLPMFSNENVINEREYIEKIYKRLGDNIVGIDVYPQLFANKKNDVFYKTDSSITNYAAYLIYNALSYRLNFNYYDLKYFTKNEVGLDFYGNLYNESLYKQLPPDEVYYYHPNIKFNGYVENWNMGECKAYYTLFPEEATISGNPNDIVLGGNGLQIIIKNYSSNVTNRTLLVVGDDSAVKILPFLALHYGEIRFMNVMNKNYIEKPVNTSEFNEALLMFSLENITSKNLYDKLEVIA